MNSVFPLALEDIPQASLAQVVAEIARYVDGLEGIPFEMNVRLELLARRADALHAEIPRIAKDPPPT